MPKVLMALVARVQESKTYRLYIGYSGNPEHSNPLMVFWK